MFGGPGAIAGDIAFAAAGVFGLAAAFSGWLVRPLGTGERIAICVASAACVLPSAVPVALPIVYAVRVAGTAALGLLVWRQVRSADAATLPRKAKAS